jgi:hypothetical protein
LSSGLLEIEQSLFALSRSVGGSKRGFSVRENIVARSLCERKAATNFIGVNTQASVDKFARFYLIPGQGHCGGIFAARHD